MTSNPSQSRDQQAFPHGDPTHGGDTGMTLRDYFAAKAMQAYLSGHVTRYGTAGSDIELAKKSYGLADAMLKARKNND